MRWPGCFPTASSNPISSPIEATPAWESPCAGPRASQYLIIGGKARAILDGRFYVTIKDVQSVVKPVLRHRILTNFTAESEGVSSLDIIQRLVETVPR